jgi:two-component system, chemotaxis family, protein-glutamate methylesterase/glutaminase
MSKIRVLVVDDSALMRKLLTEILSADPAIDVVGTATDAMQAWQKIQALHPDAITLDVEMPKMDGLTFLEKLMRARPTPVVMISTLTERGAQTTLRALELGAVDFVAKPKIDVSQGTVHLGQQITEKVKAAARARLRAAAAAVPATRVPATPKARPQVAAHGAAHGAAVIAIGASTGGTEALRVVLGALPPDAPGVVVVQHMPPGYTAAFASRLDQLSRIHVSEARHGDRIEAGHAYIAPGDRHLRVGRAGPGYVLQLSDEERRNHHRPSVDVLFESVSRTVGRQAIAAILTGMGNDGARGLLDLRFAGASTVAQDEATSLVFGMPKEAIALGAAQWVLPLDEIGPALMRLVGRSAAV